MLQGEVRMGNLDFKCVCGVRRFLNSIDNLEYRAYFIPDQDYDEFSGKVDDAIEKSGPEAKDKDRACMAWREYKMLRIWQCCSCGSVYIESPDGSHHRFVPSSGDVPKQLFKRRAGGA